MTIVRTSGVSLCSVYYERATALKKKETRLRETRLREILPNS